MVLDIGKQPASLQCLSPACSVQIVSIQTGIVAPPQQAYTEAMGQLYDIYFAGQLVEEFDEAVVRENLAKLFKVNDVALEKLFSGKPQPIKRGVDKAGAIKYKTAMARAGAI